MIYLALLAIALGVLIGILRGGNLRNFSNLRLRGLWWALVAFALQLALLLTPLGPLLGPAVAPLHTLTYALLLIPIVLNFHVPGMRLIAVGLALNVVAIVANGGFMPISADALRSMRAEGELVVLEERGWSRKSVLATESSRLLFLSDWVPVPVVRRLVSPGDLVVALGGLVLVMGVMGSRQSAVSSRQAGKTVGGRP